MSAIPDQFYGNLLTLWVMDELRQSLPRQFTLRDCMNHLLQLRGIAMSVDEQVRFLVRLRVVMKQVKKLGLVSAEAEPIPDLPMKIRYRYTNLTQTITP